MEERVAHNRGGQKPTQPVVPAAAPAPDLASILFVAPEGYMAVDFTYRGKPVGKPRMTQRDKFHKRPAAQRYWDFKAALRATAGPLLPGPDMVVVSAWVPMPPSWSKTKKEAMACQPCRQKPDWDNIGKAVCDALFDEDACIWVGVTIKYWCLAGQERLNVKILYAKS